MAERRWLALFLIAAMAGALAFVLIPGGGQAPSGQASTANSSKLASFTYLAGQHSNRCDLQAAEIRSMPSRGRLQGSCCSAMDEANYRRQRAALAQYGAIPLIPTNPYDIPVGLAQRLLALRRQVKLSGSERAAYRQAMALSAERGPCCCHCWRWQAFRGLSEYLLARRHWPAPQLASLIGDLDGCGGAA